MKTSITKFLDRFTQSFAGQDPIIFSVLANIFSMRIIGNKTHGDLAEIALTEYINQFVKGFSAKHTGKEKFRAKVLEEDIRVHDEETGESLPLSIKTYGSGPLQLSTNKESSMFPYLKEKVDEDVIKDEAKIKEILKHGVFASFKSVNVLPLIYNEKQMNFKIIIFDLLRAYRSVKKIEFCGLGKDGGNRETFPIYKFFGKEDQYIFEVRYGDAKANALQRGMWTHTENAKPFFKELLHGTYQINEPLINLISKILVSKRDKHLEILKLFPAPEKSVI